MIEFQLRIESNRIECIDVYSMRSYLLEMNGQYDDGMDSMDDGMLSFYL